jgi:cation diffusion facilitator CzcD-associated flavoprotein CzcO
MRTSLLTELNLPAQDRELLERNLTLRERLEARLRHCGESLRQLSRSKLRQLVLGHLRDLLAAPAAATFCAEPSRSAAAHAVTDEDVERKFGPALQRLPSGQQTTARSKLRAGMARDAG